MLKLTQIRKEPEGHPEQQLQGKLWHFGTRRTLSLGCTACQEYDTCGGLSVESTSYDCLYYCCHQPENCYAVCRNKPMEFVRRIREIQGFRLGNVPRAGRLPEPPLPSVVPVLYHGNSRERAFSPPAVCLSLYSIVPRYDGTERYANEGAVAEAYRFRRGAPVILTGTDKDAPLERWWNLGSTRLEVIHRLQDLGVVLVTTPNFSLFTNLPRWDDMHSMKRIAITHEEFLRKGMPAALHVNARTERDWERWTNFVQQRSEITHIAFEFATGAGASGRVEWHVDQLCGLARGVSRPLHLVVRAASDRILPKLVSAFVRTTVLDTTSFIKTVHRQRAVGMAHGKIVWETSPTAKNAPLDDLLEHNWSRVRERYEPVVGMEPMVSAAA